MFPCLGHEIKFMKGKKEKEMRCPTTLRRRKGDFLGIRLSSEERNTHP